MKSLWKTIASLFSKKQVKVKQSGRTRRNMTAVITIDERGCFDLDIRWEQLNPLELRGCIDVMDEYIRKNTPLP